MAKPSLPSCATYLGSNYWVRTGEIKLWVAGNPGEQSASDDPWRDQEWSSVTVESLLRRRTWPDQSGGLGGGRACLFGEALEREPSDEDLRRGRATALYRLGKFAEAASESDRMLQLQPDDTEAELYRAGCLLLAGDDEAYRRFCREVRTRRGWQTNGWQNIFVARIHTLGGPPAEAPEEALAQAKQFVAQQQGATTLRFTLAWTTYRAGQWDEAIRQFEALQMGNAPTDAHNVIHWTGMALCHFRAGRPEQGRPLLDKAARPACESAPGESAQRRGSRHDASAQVD